MKINFNNYILDSQEYLVNIFDNNHIPHVDYEKYNQIHDVDWRTNYENLFNLSDAHGIDIYPYLYTFSIVSEKERMAFHKFLITYMKKSDLNIGENNNDTLEIVSGSLENLVVFIFTMQYFFL